MALIYVAGAGRSTEPDDRGCFSTVELEVGMAIAKLRVGSDEHRKLMCREFINTFGSYEVRDIRWPELDPDDLARLRAMPFWTEALNTERTAAKRIRLMVEAEQDPLVREAIAVQAHEEERHAGIFESLMREYGIEVPEPEPYMARQAEWGFIRMGYGEVFDIFFAFGLFKLAAEAQFFPPPLVEIFERLMGEEARHIIFFSNWAAWRGHNVSVHAKPWFMMQRSMAFAVQALGRMHTAAQIAFGNGPDQKGDDFVIQAPAEICGDVTIRKFMETCLSENERRMARFDPRLPRPTLIPRLIRFALRFTPQNGASSDTNGNGAAH
jgi:hypothetical protein